MSRLDALEKAVVSLAKQAGLAYDLKGTGLENDPLGDADGDGRPNILDSHPKSAIQAGTPLKKMPAAPHTPITLPPTTSVSSASGMSNDELIDTITTLVLVKLLNNLKGSSGQTAAPGPTVKPVSPTPPKPVQDFADLSYDYQYLYDTYNKIYFVDDNYTVIDGSSLVGDLVSKQQIPTSSQVSILSYSTPQDYIDLRDHYRKLWDSYHLNVGTPPHFAQKR